MFGQSGVRYSENPVYAIPVTVAVLWLAFLVNLVGLRVGKWPGLLGGISTYLIAALLCVFGLVVAWRFGSATHFQFIPEATWDNLNFWSQIALAMTGLELAPILAGEIHNPGKNIPRAAWLSGFLGAGFYMAGTAAMLVLLAPERISPMTGLAQAGNLAGTRLGASWLSPVFALLITLGVIGQLTTYIAGNTRLPFAIGLDRYLPEAFAKLHPRWHTPHVSILTQAILSTLFLLLTKLCENLPAAYQILIYFVLIATLIPFVYIFATGFKYGQRLAVAAGALHLGLRVVLPCQPRPWYAFVVLVGRNVTCSSDS